MGLTKKGGGKGKQSTSVSARNVRRERLAAIGNPVGTVAMFAGASTAAPTGWLVCDGSEVLQSMYPELYALIGTTYGTAGTGGYFVLPDFQNHSPSGVDSGGLCTSLGASVGRSTSTGTTQYYLGVYFIIRAY